MRRRRSEWLNSARGKTGDDFLPEVAKAVSKMMANRSDRRLPSLFMTETQRGRLSDEAKTRGFHQGQGHIRGPIKRPDICKQPDSPILCGQRCVEAGSIYAITSFLIGD